MRISLTPFSSPRSEQPTVLTIALCFLAMSVGHACITSRLWRADIAEVEWFPAARPPVTASRPSMRPKISKPIPVDGHDSMDEKWGNIDLESQAVGSVSAMSLPSEPERVQTRFSRFSLYRIAQRVGGSKISLPSRLDTSEPPQWARMKSQRPGIDAAFPSRPAPPPSVPARLAPARATSPPPPSPPARNEATLPPTPVTTRPSNPEPPSPTSAPPTPPSKTLTRQIAELELSFVFDEGQNAVLPKARTPRSVRSYASTDFAASSVYGSSPPRPHPLASVEEHPHWLDLPPVLRRQSGYDSEAYCASSVYSQPSMPPTRSLVPRK